MPRICLSNTSRALYHVFISPNLSKATPPLIQRTAISSFQSRGIHYKRKVPIRQALSDHFTFDNAITAPRINLVDEDNVFHENIYTDQVSWNNTTHHLVEVVPAKVDEDGNIDPGSLPTCKIMTKIDLRQRMEHKTEVKKKETKGSGPPQKNLELNWAIAGGDLKHRLDKLSKFLTEGRKVEIMLGPKRKGRQATTGECEQLLKAIRETVASCRGSGETKQPEGEVGRVMTLIFEGRKLEHEKETANVPGEANTPVEMMERRRTNA